jgi:UDP-glucose 4-epimerase
LITGAQGLIGRYLTARILDLEPDGEVVGIGRSSRIDASFTHAISGRDGPEPAPVPEELLANLGERYRYQRLSLLDTPRLRELVRALRPDFIFHLASALHTAPVRELVETNIEGTASLMDAVDAASGSEAVVILGSSGSVYGEPPVVPVRESAPCNPANMYGVTKLAAEHIVRIGAARNGRAFVTARIFNVVGPGQTESHVCARLAAQLAARPRALETGALHASRDFIDVRDVAAGLLLLARRGGRGETYNLGSGRETPVHLVLSELLRISGSEVEIVRRDERPAGVRRHCADVSRLQALGFVPAYSLGESLRDLFAYHQAVRNGRGRERIPA